MWRRTRKRKKEEETKKRKRLKVIKYEVLLYYVDLKEFGCDFIWLFFFL
jgi:hypothetical protein